jgi:hypothetical protein
MEETLKLDRRKTVNLVTRIGRWFKSILLHIMKQEVRIWNYYKNASSLPAYVEWFSENGYRIDHVLNSKYDTSMKNLQQLVEVIFIVSKSTS